ncbi:aminotransferase class V-fold PLP-dependent enzyme [Spirochaeta africana]|nr:SufS family cysteine desulfurase [Spirochaeta africana]
MYLSDATIDNIRSDFPILQRTMRGKPLVYLDNGATSLTPLQVIEAESRYYTEYNANIHRGHYEYSEQATVAFDETRELIKEFLHVPADGHIIFTKSATESVNLVAYSWARKFLQPGDEIVTTGLEHHANLVPWQAAAQATGAILRFIPITDSGQLDTARLDEVIGEKTRLVALSAMSNVTGYMPPLEPVIAAARRVGALVFLDGAQLVSHHPVDLRRLDVDFLAFSAHKMLGPTGVGVLYGREAVLDAMDPFLYGGDMIESVFLDHSTWDRLPQKFEAGTPNIAGVIGFGAAIRYLQGVGMDAIAAHEHRLLEIMLREADSRPWLQVFGGHNPAQRGGIFSFNIDGVHPHDTGALLDSQGVAIRTGSHCAQPLMRHWNIPGTSRAVVYLYNTVEDVQRFFAAVDRAHDLFA